MSNAVNAALLDDEATGKPLPSSYPLPTMPTLTTAWATEPSPTMIRPVWRINLARRYLEGDSGFTPAVFTVTLSTPADFIIVVDYAVSSGFGDTGAKEGEDFMAASGTLTFQPGETVQTYTVQIIADTMSETDERFSSLISNANVPISPNGSSGTILNDDDYLVFLPIIIH